MAGKELSDISEESLMEHITLVRHNSYLFKGTVADNLRLGKGDATTEEMEAALDRVNLLGFLRGQQGLSTMLLERGNNFSGGSASGSRLPEHCCMIRRFISLTRRRRILIRKAKI